MTVVEQEAPKMERDEDTPRMVHYESFARDKTSLCGAPVLGIRTQENPLDCVVCAQLWKILS